MWYYLYGKASNIRGQQIFIVVGISQTNLTEPLLTLYVGVFLFLKVNSA